MHCKFYKWYSQALGATLGIIACIFGYLNGYMFVYTNIEGKFDYLGANGIISSYFLLPMCVSTLIFAGIRIYCEGRIILNIPFDILNKIISIATIFIGFLGTRLYFTIPSILIIIGFISFNKIISTVDNGNSSKDIDTINDESSREAKLLNTRKDIAIELIQKGANIEFISDITGFSKDEIINIKMNVQNQ